MSPQLAGFLLALIGTYAAVGFVFALVFVARGAESIDPAAAGSSLGFRLLIVPGSTALWPFLAWRWMRGQRAPGTSYTAHDRAAETRRP